MRSRGESAAHALCAARGRDHEHVGPLRALARGGRVEAVAGQVAAPAKHHEGSATGAAEGLDAHRARPDEHGIRALTDHAEDHAIGARRERLGGAVVAGRATVEGRHEVQAQGRARDRLVLVEQGLACARSIRVDARSWGQDALQTHAADFSRTWR